MAPLSVDLAILNATVHTLNPRQPNTQAVAITKNRILKVGSNAEISKLITDRTHVLDLKGKTVVPGLIDTHIHVADFGRYLMWLDLTSAQSIGDLQRMLKEKASHTPANKWIIGQGWNETRFKENRAPTTQDLDVAAPDNPAILYREAAMVCVANSNAQKLAGVTEQTPTPKGGTIDKDASGKLTGIFRDTAASLIWQAVPEPSLGDLLDAAVLALTKIVEAGITTIHWLVLAEVELEIIQRLNDEGKLPIRVYVVVPEKLLEKAQKLKSADPLRLRFGGATVNVDGYLDSKEAALSEPYSDDPKNRGRLLCSGKDLAGTVQRVLAAGLQPILVAMGDRAVGEALKVIEEIPKASVRFRIEQTAMLNESLLQRLRHLNVVVSVQPKMISTEFTVWSAKERLGEERAQWLHPLKALVDAGVRVAGGSDCPMEPLSPFLGMQEAVLRVAFPEQRLTVLEALRMYTADAAYSAGEENLKGSIEEGKLADLTILSEDPTAVAPEEIRDIAVEMVILNGKISIQLPFK